MPITVAPSAVIAQDRSVSASEQQPIDIHIADAARRFDIPQPWIRAVMEVESAGNPRAVSHAGAMGLIQIMPGTWPELRVAYRLGNDPFDTRDNILAGNAYLRQMYDRLGSPGFLAAYNAGPARDQNHLDTGRALPRETRNYLAILAPLIAGGTDVARAVSRPHRTQDWRDAPLFAATAEAGPPPVTPNGLRLTRLETASSCLTAGGKRHDPRNRIMARSGMPGRRNVPERADAKGLNRKSAR
ncbi:lytic transglycosylase domain-containing protein [Phaeobacter sp. B1627]|nr:lytic transglycosylase domain-containing protein [Phaeobacter sp. B1627]